MIHELLYHVLAHREDILEKAEKLNVAREDAEKKWIRFTPEKVASIERVAAVDGSMNYMTFRSFILYAVDAEAVVYDGAGFREKLVAYDVDLLYPERNAPARVRYYMATLEMRIARKALDDYGAECILLDGSILGYFNRPHPTFLKKIPIHEKRALVNKYGEKILEAVTQGSLTVISKTFYDDLLHNCDYNVTRANKLAVFLERVEYLLSILYLITKAQSRVISVSKTSVSRRYFRTSLKPDLVVFSKLIHDTGFSKPEVVKVKVPVYVRELLNVSPPLITVFFARLQKGAPVFKFEVPGQLSEDEVKEVLSSLESLSVNGYPHPLAIVHNDVEISDRDMTRIYKILSLYGEEKGREVLAP